MSFSYAWVDGPLQLLETPGARHDINDHPAHLIANDMAYAHNCMIRGLNALYVQAPNIPAPDVPDFLFFAVSLAEWIMHHHELEASMIFSSFESIPGVVKGSMQGNIEQHHAFESGLKALRQYSTEAHESFDGTHFNSLIGAFGKEFRQHLADEIPTPWAMDCVPNNSPESKRLSDLWKRINFEAAKIGEFHHDADGA
ncbi:hypothetical protein BDV96DRAFT_661247 [Lophiotrema nucula]|uniref:Hemerythrin-like domain-containing protein n=1 Tax=Lophiotrema nucula TaxID=690887 RepID=A0A6A5Z6L8_9PLEO|nr:hypothetical protein BDV96DRAFT_661247 [Lophiotrema nucula]